MKSVRSTRGTILIFLFCLFAVSPTHAQLTTNTTPTSPYEFDIPSYGMKLTVPNSNWRVVSTETWLEVYHQTLKDVLISVNATYSIYANPLDAANDEKKFIRDMTPGAIYVIDNQEFNMGDTKAVSFTYKNPSTLLLIRSVFFVSNGKSWHLKFEFNESSLNLVKDDLAFILKNFALTKLQDRGGEVYNKELMARLKAPSVKWRVTNYAQLIRVTFVQASDNIIQANADVFPCNYTTSSLETVYAQHISSIMQEIPAQVVLKDKQTATLGGSIPALYRVYRDPSKQIVNKDLVYIHNGQCRIFQFSFLEKSYDMLKNDFTWVQDNAKFD